MARTGAARGGEGRCHKDRKVAKVAHVAAAVRLTTVEYLANSGMVVAASGYWGLQRKEGWCRSLRKTSAKEENQPGTSVVEVEGGITLPEICFQGPMSTFEGWRQQLLQHRDKFLWYVCRISIPSPRSTDTFSRSTFGIRGALR